MIVKEATLHLELAGGASAGANAGLGAKVRLNGWVRGGVMYQEDVTVVLANAIQAGGSGLEATLSAMGVPEGIIDRIIATP